MMNDRPALPVMHAVLTVVLLILVTLPLSCSRKSSDKEQVLPMAEIGDYTVTSEEFLGAFRNVFDRSGQALQVTPSVLREILDQRVSFYSIVQHGIDQGWHEDYEGLHQKNLIYRQVMMDEFRESFLKSDIRIEESDLEELFLRYNTHLRASHLYAPDRETADSLHQLVKNGASFEQLARDIFDSQSLRESGGDLGYFTVDDMDVGFENTAYSMAVGEISDPVRTSRGFSIIKVTDRITTPIITEYQYAQNKNRIRDLAIRQKAELRQREHMDEIIDAYSFDEQLLADLREWLDGHLGVDPVADVETEGFHSRVPQEYYGSIVASHDGFDLTVEMLLQETWYTPLETRRNIDNRHSFRNLVEGVAYRAYAMNAYENSPHYDEELVALSVENTFQNYLNRRLYRTLESEVEIPAHVLAEEYHNNPDQYMYPREVNVAELAVRDMDTAEKAWDAIQAGMSFQDALMKYGFDEEAKQVGGEIGYTPVSNFGSISPALSEIQPGELAGPFEMTSDVIFLFKCLGVREAEPMTFEEAKPRIMNNLTEMYVMEMRRNIIGETKERHNARVHYDRIDEVDLKL
ncbi:foldase protein PrsA [Natronogracilivirga saccharolytica]|uniref:Peptidylprolyl isomerase n=1 Tax=Natronogracilivirga saccharolytica TaxID=2812953 RepID=A0A8J7RHC0_9BACT|nr:peptidylprolyl isomerase [Natronogracilivirga saccharolytica]MBP3191212.1 peptidylprolyl isomerase [Natronogracilivirga saccharolytica]